MPFYEVEHVCPLTTSQCEAIMEAITDAHCKIFTVPSLLVNVRFVDTSNTITYTARKRSSYNFIKGNVRHNASRPPLFYKDLMERIAAAWERSVGTKGDLELRGIFLIGALVGAVEAGILIPEAGQDKTWLKDNIDFFKSKADEGDQDFKDALVEMEDREDLKAVL